MLALIHPSNINVVRFPVPQKLMLCVGNRVHQYVLTQQYDSYKLTLWLIYRTHKSLKHFILK